MLFGTLVYISKRKAKFDIQVTGQQSRFRKSIWKKKKMRDDIKTTPKLLTDLHVILHNGVEY